MFLIIQWTIFYQPDKIDKHKLIIRVTVDYLVTFETTFKR